MQCRTAAGRLWSLPRQRPHKLRPIPISQFPIILLSLFCQCQKRPAGIRRALLVYRGINLSVSLCSTRPGCGSQHPQRFACVLLTAAPTTTPCFRHWRRSSLLPLVGEPLAKPFTSRGLPKPPLLGEVARRRRDGEVIMMQLSLPPPPHGSPARKSSRCRRRRGRG